MSMLLDGFTLKLSLSIENTNVISINSIMHERHSRLISDVKSSKGAAWAPGDLLLPRMREFH